MERGCPGPDLCDSQQPERRGSEVGPGPCYSARAGQVGAVNAPPPARCTELPPSQRGATSCLGIGAQGRSTAPGEQPKQRELGRGPSSSASGKGSSPHACDWPPPPGLLRVAGGFPRLLAHLPALQVLAVRPQTVLEPGPYLSRACWPGAPHAALGRAAGAAPVYKRTWLRPVGGIAHSSGRTTHTCPRSQ